MDLRAHHERRRDSLVGIVALMVRVFRAAPGFHDEGRVTWLYPPIEPYRTGRLQVSPVHELYFEQNGNRNSAGISVPRLPGYFIAARGSRSPAPSTIIEYHLPPRSRLTSSASFSRNDSSILNSRANPLPRMPVSVGSTIVNGFPNTNRR